MMLEKNYDLFISDPQLLVCESKALVPHLAWLDWKYLNE